MNTRKGCRLRDSGEAFRLGVLLLLAVSLRASHLDQPIVENYVGRQIPTAMVARNLDRGGSFLRPELMTGPFPSYFLVEPPVFAGLAVGMHRATGLGLEASGRLVSALAIALGGWGMYGLARRREGPAVALVVVAAFVTFPVTIRYGRAFQGDALMLGSLIAALRCWDEHEAGGSWGWGVAGGILLAAGLALKVTAAYVLVPLIGVVLRPRNPGEVALAVGAMVPALLWYVHAARLLASEGTAASASAENAAHWARVLLPTALVRMETWVWVGRFLVVRAFTPVGFALAAWGLWRRDQCDRLWTTWGAAAMVALGVLAGKLHHEYYFLAVAPVMAVGLARGLRDLASRNRLTAGVAGLAFVSLAAVQSASTFRTPLEWAAVIEAAARVREVVPPGRAIIAPEALIYYADRPGCRLEEEPKAIARAVREWGPGASSSVAASRPQDLLRFYEDFGGARYFADVCRAGESARRHALHEAIRRDPECFPPVRIDRPGGLLLSGPGPGSD